VPGGHIPYARWHKELNGHWQCFAAFGGKAAQLETEAPSTLQKQNL
jgi:hypothetical protein